MKVLVANSPRMYREALAMAVLKHFPDAEMLIASPEALDGQVERFSPHVVVRNYDGQDLGVPEGVVCWVSVRIADMVEARIFMGGRVTELHDATMEDLLAALDGAADRLRADGGRAEPSFY